MLYCWHLQWKLQYEDDNVYRCQSEDRVVDLKILDNDNGDYKGTTALKSYYDRSDKKRT